MRATVLGAQRRRGWRLIMLGAGAAVLSGSPASAQSIRYLEPAPGGILTIPWAISADGTTVVGESDVYFGPPPVKHAARWVITTPPYASVPAQELGVPLSGAWAQAVNFDGRVVVGKLDSDSFRWTVQDGMDVIVPFGSNAPSIATGVSADGTIVFGWATATFPDVSYRWSLNNGVQAIGDFHVTGCTGDGMHASGYIPIGVNPSRAVQWNGAMSVVSDDGSVAYAISSGTSPVVMAGWNGSGQGVIWINGTQVSTPVATPYAVSGDGRTIGGSGPGPEGTTHGYIWTAELGLVDLNTYLPSIGVNLNIPYPWVINTVTALSYDGQVIAGYGTLGGGFLRGFVVDMNHDTDGDGLSDDWETNGIPYFSTDGTAHRYVLPGANPLRKDIYVEVDAMAGMAPAQATLDRVAQVFSLAPVPAVPNSPGALPGISLHATLDQTTVPAYDYILNNGWEEFHADKDLFFGTQAEQDNPDWSEMKKAKAKAYRYCIFARAIPFETTGRVLGVAEVDLTRSANGPRMGGNDFMFGFEGYILPSGVSLDDAQAATFMHELGHTLGLYHGGGHPYLNFNPNHYSVMNYTWAGVRRGPGGGQFVLLDYDRHALPPLSEFYLDESAGIGGTPDLLGVLVPVFVREPLAPGPCVHEPLPPSTLGTCHAPYGLGLGTCIRYFMMVGPVDWNNDGIISSSSHRVCADPNGDGDYIDLLSGPLTSVNEWNLLAYDFRESPGYSDLVNMQNPAPCPSPALEQFLSSLPPPPPPVQCPVPPVAGAPSPVSSPYCLQGDLPSFTIAPQGAAPLTIQWRWFDEGQDPPAWVDLAEGWMPNGAYIDGAQDGALRIYSANSFGAGTVRLSCRVTDACGQTGDSSECTLLTGGPVVTTASPLSVIGCPGLSASFSVTADGPSGPFAYEWQTFGPGLADGVMPNGTIVSGAQTPTLTLSNINPADFGALEVLNCSVSDGCQGGNSDFFFFSPRGVVITGLPQDVSLPCTGTPQAQFTVTAEGEALSYAWRKDGAPLTDGGRISGAASPTLTIAAPTVADAGYYDCVITSACGGDTTSAAFLNIGPPQLRFEPPLAQLTCLGDSAYMSADATGSPPLTYQWRRDGVDLQDGARIFGAHEPFLAIAPVEPGDLGLYTVRVTNDCGEAVSQGTTLALYPAAAIGAQPADAQTCPAGSVTLTVAPAVEGPASSFRWEREDPVIPGQWIEMYDGQLWLGVVAICGNVSGAYTSSMTIAWTGEPICRGPYGPRRFRCRVGSTCDSVFSTPATVTFVWRGDMNCDCAVNNFDLDAFVLALLDPSGYAAVYPSCSILHGDIDGDLALNNFDIDPFVDCLLYGCP